MACATQVGPPQDQPEDTEALSTPKIVQVGDYKVAVNEITAPNMDNVSAFDNLQVQLRDKDVLFLRRGDQFKSPKERV